MWLIYCSIAVSLFNVVLCQNDTINGTLTSRILEALERNLLYIDANYDRINVDCLFGVVLCGDILEDAKETAGPYLDAIERLQNLTLEIYEKSAPVLRNKTYDSGFVDYLTVPGVWAKRLEFQDGRLPEIFADSNLTPDILRSVLRTDSRIETIIDSCINDIFVQTNGIDLQMCQYKLPCRLYLFFLNTGHGYVTTHKLILLQIANLRRCFMDPRPLQKAKDILCARIYSQVLTEAEFIGIDSILDLFLEQIFVCGYEGYSNFLKPDYLEQILDLQEESGCFKPYMGVIRMKRDSNQLQDGCADHTTGLGTAALSIYLNYNLKINDDSTSCESEE